MTRKDEAEDEAWKVAQLAAKVHASEWTAFSAVETARALLAEARRQVGAAPAAPTAPRAFTAD